jgi:CubicO group peptidase (beta-lactamase class C family)
MLEFMARTGTTAATLEIRKKNGDVLLHQGYGWLDAARTRETPPDAMMRILSITKSFVHLAINQLAANGTISKNARVFCLHNEMPSGTGCLLSIAPAGNDGIPHSDADNITVQQLLDHRAGWDEGTADANGVHEPAGDSLKVAAVLNISTPPAVEQLIAYQLDQDLDYRPGARSVYSNFGYTVLGHVIEQYSGLDFMRYIHEHITDDLRIPRSEIELGKELITKRNPREPRYIDRAGAPVPNLFSPASPRVKRPDGGFLLERAAGASGIISTTSALLDYMRAYSLFNPAPRTDGSIWSLSGGGPGTLALAVQNSPVPGLETEADWVVNMNTNPVGESLHQDLCDLIRNTLIKGVAIDGNGGVANSSRFFTLYVPENSRNLRFSTEGGVGDLDLYVSFGARPTTSVSDCRSVTGTGTARYCVIPNPSPGTYYVMTHANTVYNGVSISGDYETRRSWIHKGN